MKPENALRINAHIKTAAQMQTHRSKVVVFFGVLLHQFVI